jgi:2-polyprenyl-3-methyl-5-hydroxy-6-metoxy-1,4-benzoquinol methylase
MLDDKARRRESHGWFATPARPGDRTLEQQLRGLEPLLADVAGKTVLDVGCAEGLIGIECARAGAVHVRGIEIVPGHVAIARSLKSNLPCHFAVADANDYVPHRQYDVVLLLALLHKLKEPTRACWRLARAADSLCVIRFPEASRARGAIIVDERSRNVTQHIGATMFGLGFGIERVTSGPFDEQTFYFRRGLLDRDD